MLEFELGFELGPGGWCCGVGGLEVEGDVSLLIRAKTKRGFGLIMTKRGRFQKQGLNLALLTDNPAVCVPREGDVLHRGVLIVGGWGCVGDGREKDGKEGQGGLHFGEGKEADLRLMADIEIMVGSSSEWLRIIEKPRKLGVFIFEKEKPEKQHHVQFSRVLSL